MATGIPAYQETLLLLRLSKLEEDHMALKRNNPTLDKTADEEEVFALVARDQSSPKTVILWIAENIRTAPAEKLREALECAPRMRRHPSKAAD